MVSKLVDFRLTGSSDIACFRLGTAAALAPLLGEISAAAVVVCGGEGRCACCVTCVVSKADVLVVGLGLPKLTSLDTFCLLLPLPLLETLLPLCMLTIPSFKLLLLTAVGGWLVPVMNSEVRPDRKVDSFSRCKLPLPAPAGAFTPPPAVAEAVVARGISALRLKFLLIFSPSTEPIELLLLLSTLARDVVETLRR